VSGKVTIDTVADLVSVAYDANHLAHEHGAVVLDFDIGVVEADALCLRRRDGHEQEHAS
jgi:hypothetical protein